MLVALTTSVALAATPNTIKYESAPVEQKVEIIKLQNGSPETTAVAVIVRDMASKYNINFDDFYNTLWCESHFVPQQSRVPSKTGPNGREDSWGVPQIHLPDHPEISIDQAMDIAWSIEWAAKEFSEGRQSQWSCYKLLKNL